MIKSLSFIFYPKKQQSKDNTLSTIYLRITLDSRRAEVSTGLTIESNLWNSAGGRVAGKGEKSKRFNSHLDAMESKLYDAYHQLLRENKPITAEILRNKLTGKTDAPQMIVTIFKKHNEDMASLVPKEFSAATIVRYRTSLSHTVDFLKHQYNVSDIDIRNINHEFVTQFDFYLRSVRNCANNTTVKYLKNFKKIVRICLANGWMDTDPFAKYKVRIKEIDRESLTEAELNTMINKQYQIERLAQVRDVFIFSCFTGLAYIDVKKLCKHDIVTGIDGNKWLNINRTKTDTPTRVPLLRPALDILARYSHHPICEITNSLLPVLSNQKMNSYLKEIADTCGITKILTFHIARHTFATTVTLNNDVPIESVSKMLGHKKALF